MTASAWSVVNNKLGTIHKGASLASHRTRPLVSSPRYSPSLLVKPPPDGAEQLVEQNESIRSEMVRGILI